MAKAKTPSDLSANSRDLVAELDWLSRVIEARFAIYFGDKTKTKDITKISPPGLPRAGSPYARMVQTLKLDFHERLAVILALAPHVRPQTLDAFYTRNKAIDRRFTEFGGIHRGEQMVPTGETLAWLFAGSDIERRFQVHQVLEPENRLLQEGVLILNPEWPGQPLLQIPLMLGEEYLFQLTTGRPYRPTFGSSFPARPIEPRANWKDLILNPKTHEQLQEIRAWIEHNSELPKWGFSDPMSQGLRCLFHGPPGTGKTLAAGLLGQWTGREVYRIDLSMVVSKYIGETEKNLAQVFDRADRRGWILFFDEADALFGKRVETKDAHDRYANQEVSYLLQRIESFSGIVILASNLKDNIDDAFARRFQVMVHFPMPGAEERLRLWRSILSSKARLGKDVDLKALANAYKLTGAAITNAARFAVLRALADGKRPITDADLVTGVRRELAKEGKAA